MKFAHLRRGDIHAQLLATGLRCLFWFNPLLHYAARMFRFDQELACDATVLAAFPRGRGRYGSAMLKTQLAGFGLPVGCHWQSSHPLKERIEMLKQPLPARMRKRTGAAMVAVLMCAGTWAAWAAQPAQPAQAARAPQAAKAAQSRRPRPSSTALRRRTS
jgi:beta-lactamase regulating signal transducer with metallopeptidase domain